MLSACWVRDLSASDLKLVARSRSARRFRFGKCLAGACKASLLTNTTLFELHQTLRQISRYLEIGKVDWQRSCVWRAVQCAVRNALEHRLITPRSRELPTAMKCGSKVPHWKRRRCGASVTTSKARVTNCVAVVDIESQVWCQLQWVDADWLKIGPHKLDHLHSDFAHFHCEQPHSTNRWKQCPRTTGCRVISALIAFAPTLWFTRNPHPAHDPKRGN